MAGDWRLTRFGNANTRTWLEGDCHAENAGAFSNDEGEVVYGLNDFDESIIADYQYDLWRFGVSLLLVARQNGGFSTKDEREIIDALSDSYLDTLASYIGNKKANKIQFTSKNTSGRLRKFLKETEKNNSRDRQLEEWTIKKKGKRRFNLELEKLAPVTEEEREEIIIAMQAYGKTLSGGISYDRKFFKVKDIARRLSAGTGSLGTPRFYVLIEGRTKPTNHDRILDVKRQSKPTAYLFLSQREELEYDLAFSNDAEHQAVAYNFSFRSL